MEYYSKLSSLCKTKREDKGGVNGRCCRSAGAGMFY